MDRSIFVIDIKSLNFFPCMDSGQDCFAVGVMAGRPVSSPRYMIQTKTQSNRAFLRFDEYVDHPKCRCCLPEDGKGGDPRQAREQVGKSFGNFGLYWPRKRALAAHSGIDGLTLQSIKIQHP